MYLCRNNKCAQVFASDFGWVSVSPMKTKGKGHKALSLMFQGEGVDRFHWCVPHMLKKRDAIIALVKKHSTKYLKSMLKVGIQCPKTVEDALELVKHNGNTMWSDAIAKEMKNF